MLSTEIFIVIAVILFLIISLYKDWMRPVIVFFIAAVVLFVAGITDAKDFLTGFGNEQIAVVFLLLMLSDIIQKTGLLDIALKTLIKPNLTYKGFLGRMMICIAPISAFINNSPLVAITTPYAYDWAKRNKISPSKVLMPLSFAIVVTGTITLIGTSTNLVVNGFAIDANLNPMKMFDLTPIGIAVSILGIIYLYFIGSKLLPDRKDALTDFNQKSREYLVETQVSLQSNFIGKTVEQAGLRNLRGLFLVEIIRKSETIAPAPPSEIICQDDILIFAGETATIIDLLNSSNDLTLPKYSSMLKQENAEIVEVVISSDSSLIGKIVKDADFRAKYDSAIVAVNRNGERVSGKIGEVKLHSGDLLLLVIGKDFYSQSEESGDLHVISKLKEIRNFQKKKIWILVAATLTAFLLPAFGVLTLFKTLLILMCVIAMLGIVKLGDIKRSFDIDLFVILALALGIGKAITKSGADQFFADGIIRSLHTFDSKLAILAGVYLMTNILVLMINNRAAVAIAFPIAVAAAQKIGVDTMPFILAVTFAGSSTFMTPFCYQTNLMIYGPGGYKFKDYLRVGWGLTLIYAVTVIFMIGYIYKLY